MMIRILSTLALTAIAALPVLAEVTRTYTYVDDSPMVYYPTYRSEVVNLAIRMDNPMLTGKKITSIRAKVNTDGQVVEDCSLWVSSELKITTDADGKKVNDPDLASAPATLSDDGWLSATLSEPVVLTQAPVYVGYTFNVPSYNSAAKSPITYCQTRHDGGFYFYSNKAATKWMDYESRLLGVLPVYVTLEGDFQEYALAPAGWDTDYPYAQTGSAYTLPCRLYNMGTSEVTEFTYSYTCGEYSGKGSLRPAEALSPDIVNYSVVNVPFEPCSLSGKQTLTLHIESIDGVDVSGESLTASLPVEYRDLVPVQRVVMEEATGTWCSACPRGAAAIDELARLYPDQFIGIAYHGGKDIMKSPAVVPFTITHYPSAVVDRGAVTDPFYADETQNILHAFAIKSMIDAKVRVQPLTAISVTAAWADASASTIEAEANVAFVNGCDKAGYKVAFILLANGLQGEGEAWSQTNGMAGGNEATTPELLKPFTQLPRQIEGYVYNHVALLSAESGSEVSAALAPEQSESHRCTFTAAEAVSTFEPTAGYPLIQNNDNLEVVALLLNPDGTVCNAVKTHVGAFGSVGALSSCSPVVDTIYYDLQGRRLSMAAGGICIKVDVRADGTRTTRKIVK